ncbi:hypothetical protein HU200_044703 [Digitaria exilis]|uniref:Uncharacterized protein n=1 Tax=Digitaria exilis TaxID=1010633 RepID=A0A835BCG4_9POAL|nr:hypothetical protein HU200_044703 [Digitaria exilis]
MEKDLLKQQFHQRMEQIDEEAYFLALHCHCLSHVAGPSLMRRRCPWWPSAPPLDSRSGGQRAGVVVRHAAAATAETRDAWRCGVAAAACGRVRVRPRVEFQIHTRAHIPRVWVRSRVQFCTRTRQVQNPWYLSQQLYLRVWTPQQSFSNEYNILTKAILCGRAADLPH